MTERTYGTYAYLPPAPDERRGTWRLDLEPAVRMRARRTLARVQQTRTRVLELADTTEVARDIEWFASRYALAPADEFSATRLAVGSEQHRLQELAIVEAIAGRSTRATGEETPAKAAREYQQIAVDLLRARGRLLLTDEVGLGKTFTALLNCVHLDALPALIIPPTHLPRRWEVEVREAFPWLTVRTVKGTTPKPSVYNNLPDVLIVPYSRLDGWAARLAGMFPYVVFDEAHELRNGRATAKGEAAAIVAAPATYVLGLTATPVHNYGGDVWNIYDVFADGELGTREEFKREWAADTTSTVGKHMLVEDPHALGAYLREQGLMLGRTRAEVGRELPNTIKAQHTVDTDHKALDDVKDRVAELARKILDQDTDQQDRFQAAGEIDWQLRRATGVDKAPYVADFVRMILQSEQRVVLWGWHRDVYEIWLRELAEFHPILYTGSESPAKKVQAEIRFTTPIDDEHPLEDAARVLIMSLRSGAGVDGLQKVCRVGVFGELDWSPQVHEQCIGRLRRDGMDDTDPVVAYFLTSDEGSDPAMLDVLQEKREQAEPLVNPDGVLLQNATHDHNRARALAQSVLARTAGQSPMQGAA